MKQGTPETIGIISAIVTGIVTIIRSLKGRRRRRKEKEMLSETVEE